MTITLLHVSYVLFTTVSRLTNQSNNITNTTSPSIIVKGERNFLGVNLNTQFDSNLFSAPQVLVWPSSQSRNASDFIFPSSSTTLLSPRVCQNDSAPSPRLLVVVCSAVPHLAARATIRESWARDTASLGSVAVVFLLGRQQQDSAADDPSVSQSWRPLLGPSPG